jgi:hypothetical protein
MGESKDTKQREPVPGERASETEKMRLILAKGLFLDGCTHASESNKISRMVAIHQFDNAVEMALKIIASKRGISPKGKFFTFDELLKALPRLPLKEQITNLHIQRNLIQHGGDIPDLETVVKYRGVTKDFLTAIAESEFALSFSKLGMASMIEDSKLRGLVENAQSSFDVGTAGSYIKCIELCNHTLTETQRRVAVIGRQGTIQTSFFSFSHLGRFRSSYARFHDITARIDRIPPEKLKEQAEFSVQFITDLILKWQEEGAIREDRTGRQKR